MHLFTLKLWLDDLDVSFLIDRLIFLSNHFGLDHREALLAYPMTRVVVTDANRRGRQDQKRLEVWLFPLFFFMLPGLVRANQVQHGDYPK